MSSRFLASVWWTKKDMWACFSLIFNRGDHVLSRGVEPEGRIMLFVGMVIVGLGEEACPTSTVVARELGLVPRWTLEMVAIEVF